MTANLLTLNPSKTEFLLIGLKKQLDKIHNSSLNTTHSARKIGFIFAEHFFPTKFQPSPKLAITILDSFVVSVLTFLTPPQCAPLLPPSFTPNLITEDRQTVQRSDSIGRTVLQRVAQKLLSLNKIV